MKNLKSLLLISMLFISLSVFAGNQKVSIKTSAQCEMCKETLEASIGKLPGVSKVMLNIETKELLVKFDDEIISLDEIKTEISHTGYWADDVAPNKEAYAALPNCCKPVKACCASKSSCTKEAETKKECSKDGAKKECCSKEGAKKECTGSAH